MELYATDTNFILVHEDKVHSLWVNRRSGTFTNQGLNATKEIAACGASRLGRVYGLIGKINLSNDGEPRLLFIRQRSRVGDIRGNVIYKINSVLVLPLESEAEITLEGPDTPTDAALHRVKVFPVSQSPYHVAKRNERGNDKLERRLLEEFQKMFTEADSFYYSTEYDIANSVQRQFLYKEAGRGMESLWKLADNRFFWNHYMMADLVNAKDSELDRWILPIMQGFIEFQSCNLEPLFGSDQMSGAIGLSLISRRSRFRAGTRYLRRGVDDHGRVANYVETEQILIFKGHLISFVQVRGSIPVFWSQPGLKYRPPPRLDRSEEESYISFRKHFEEESSVYGPITIINLVEKGGREKVLGDAYMENILHHNAPEISYVSFDFHEHCRGMKFENIGTLIEKLETILRGMNYCWVDSFGLVLKQRGVCRINCVDCLDRTNVIMTHLARHMLILQLSKVGLVAPEMTLPDNLKAMFQVLWANNGDTISKQYAGTNALKGDFTRTGERKLAGVMKDGMNSANRYYLNRFKDSSRQAVIDLMLGEKKNITEADLGEGDKNMEKENAEEQIRSVIEHVKKCFISKEESLLGSWGFVNAKTNEPGEFDIDVIFILTEEHYYVAEYDCSIDSITNTEKVALKTIELIELGHELIQNSHNLFSIFNSQPGQKTVPSIRINYVGSGGNHFHQFRASHFRFFNNMAIPIQASEELYESLKVFGETIVVAAKHQNNSLNLQSVGNLIPKEGKSQMPNMASNFVRYFGFGHNDETLGSKSNSTKAKRSEPKEDLTRMTKPDNENLEEEKYFQVAKNDGKGLFDASGETNKLNQHLLSKRERKKSGSKESKELFLSSAGILVLPHKNASCDSPTMSNLLFAHHLLEFRSPKSISVQFQDPGKEKKIEEIPNPEEEMEKPEEKHQPGRRFTLPANSLGLESQQDWSSTRSITPEIHIEVPEEPDVPERARKFLLPVNMGRSNSGSSSSLSPGGKRISRSSVDVNKISSSDSSPLDPRISKGSFLDPSKKSDRSTSDIDIFGSLRLKGSHSDHGGLRENPFQPTNPQGSKRELVFAPLGKLARGMQNIGANYLDPRKIRDTFKQQGNKDPIDKPIDPNEAALQERIKNCKSLIIEI